MSSTSYTPALLVDLNHVVTAAKLFSHQHLQIKLPQKSHKELVSRLKQTRENGYWASRIPHGTLVGNTLTCSTTQTSDLTPHQISTLAAELPTGLAAGNHTIVRYRWSGLVCAQDEDRVEADEASLPDVDAYAVEVGFIPTNNGFGIRGLLLVASNADAEAFKDDLSSVANGKSSLRTAFIGKKPDGVTIDEDETFTLSSESLKSLSKAGYKLAKIKVEQ